MNRSTREGVRRVCAHSDVLSRLDEGRIRKESIHDTAEHERAGWVVFEEAVPIFLELGTQCSDLLVGGTELGADI